MQASRLGRATAKRYTRHQVLTPAPPTTRCRRERTLNIYTPLIRPRSVPVAVRHRESLPTRQTQDIACVTDRPLEHTGPVSGSAPGVSSRTDLDMLTRKALTPRCRREQTPKIYTPLIRPRSVPVTILHRRHICTRKMQDVGVGPAPFRKGRDRESPRRFVSFWGRT